MPYISLIGWRSADRKSRKYMKYGKTLFLLNAANICAGVQAGQWVEDATGVRGQYLGKTDSGTIVIRWQNGKFARRDALNNKHLRRFAKVYGSK